VHEFGDCDLIVPLDVLMPTRFVSFVFHLINARAARLTETNVAFRIADDNDTASLISAHAQ
jgi:hypothetical protein